MPMSCASHRLRQIDANTISDKTSRRESVTYTVFLPIVSRGEQGQENNKKIFLPVITKNE